MLTVSAVTQAHPDFLGDSAAGISGNANSFSGDSQFVVFESDAGNLTPGDLNGTSDVFLRDLATGITSLVSAALSGSSGNGPSFNPQISGDGRFVLFESEAKDLVNNDTNGTTRDVFVRDLLNQTTTLVSVNLNGGSGNTFSRAEAISADGRLVLFSSSSSNLVTAPVGNQIQLFVRDMAANTTTLVTANFNGTAASNGPANPFGTRAQFSPDGRFVLFHSTATDLITNDLNGIFSDVYVRDLQLGTTELVSVNEAGTGSGNHQSISPQFDPTGRYVAFVSRAQNLVAGNPFANQVYLRDLLLNTTQHISVENTFDGQQPFQSITPFLAFSPDGRYLAYEGPLTELNRQIYARDLFTNSTILVSANRFSTETTSHIADGISSKPRFSPDGNTIYFASTSTNLISENTNQVSQIYARNLAAKTTTLLSRGVDSLPGTKASTAPAVSPDGELIVFESESSNLVSADNNRLKDLFTINVASEHIDLLSDRDPLLPSEYTSRTLPTDQPQPTGMSADGRYIVFNSEAQDLVANSVSGRNAYRFDRQTGTSELVSINPDGTGGNNTTGVSGATAMSADGRYVIFSSLALNPVPGLQYAPGLQGSPRAIFVRDMQLGTTQVINRNSAGFIAGVAGEPFTISPNGRYAAFATNQSLLPGDTNNNTDVYVYDLLTQTLSLVSVNSSGTSGNSRSTIFETSAVGEVHRIFSDDGRFLLFTSGATDLVPGVGTTSATYVRDLSTGTTRLVSQKSDGTAAQGFAYAISGDGNRVVLVTNSRLLPEDSDNSFDVYLRDVATDTTKLISTEANSNASNPAISRDGSTILYSLSGFTGISLIRHDLNTDTKHTIHTGSDLDYRSALNDDGRFVAFLNASVSGNGLTYSSELLFFDSVEETTTNASLNYSGTAPSNQGVVHLRPLMNAAGSLVAFSSNSSDLTASDINGRADVFCFQRPLGGGSLRGEVFADANASGTRDVTEIGLENWKVFIDTNSDGVRQANETQVLTSASGQYAFTGLVPGTYRIVAEQRTAFVQSAPATLTYDATIIADETIADLDFGFQQQFADLRVDVVDHPLTGLPGETAFIEWEVSNHGVWDATGNWQDAVYLSRDAQLSPDDILLGTALHIGGLGIGEQYANSLNVTLPAAIPGSYHILIQTDRRGSVPQDDRSDDTLGSSTTIDLDVPELVIGIDRPGTFWGPGLRQYYKVDSPADRSLEIEVDSLAMSGGTAIYVSRGVMPTPGDFHFTAQPFEPDSRLVIPRTVDQSTYYIMVEGQFGEASTAGFTLSARLPGMKIDEVSPNQGGNTGLVTVRIDGTELTRSTRVQLFSDSATLEAVAIDFRDASQLYATFDLNGATVGSYHLFVFDGANNDLSLNAFEITNGIESPLRVSLLAASNFRVGRRSPIVVEVENVGNTDVDAPLLRLSSDQALIRLDEESGEGENDTTFLAVSTTGPAGRIRPGEKTRVVLSFLGTAVDNVVEFSLDEPQDLNSVVNWDSLKDDSRPITTSAEAWDVIWERWKTSAGSTIAEYQNLLANTASALSRLGTVTRDPDRLAEFTLAAADNHLSGSVNSDGVDVHVPTAGIELSLSRMSRQTLSGRYRVGPLGRGWTHNWEISISTDDVGNAFLRQGAITRFFDLGPGGKFRSSPGDAGVLSIVNGRFQLREVHGQTLQFLESGLFSSIEDRYGNKVTATNDAFGRLQRLTHSNTATLDLQYDSEGRLISVQGSDGQTAVYSYDQEHLTSVETVLGVTEYTYLTGDTPDREHAITSVTRTTGQRIYFDHDELGRVIATYQDGGQNSFSFSYGPSSEMTVTDDSGASATVHFNEAGQIELFDDSRGLLTAYDYDANSRLAQMILPTGDSQLFTFCGCGSLMNATDSQGVHISLTYDADYRELTSITDGAGNTTEYVRDESGSLRRIRFADLSEKTFVVDSLGNTTGVTDRRGNHILFTYNASGQVLRKDFEDGTFQEYTYDARGNRLTASNSGETIVMQYDAADRMTRIQYPNGRFLEFTYDAFGRRIRSVDQSDFELLYEYDDWGRLTAVTAGDGTPYVSYEFGNYGELLRKTVGSGAYTTYSYNSAGQLLSLVNYRPDGVVGSRFDYEYDSLGLVSSVTTLEGTTDYEYDLSGQLISATLPNGRHLIYEYDAAGNRTRVTDTGIATEYVTDVLNQYTNVGELTFLYDADGNLISRTDSSGTINFIYNIEGQLIRIDSPTGSTAFEYDALGNRVATVRNGVRTEFLIDPAGLNSVVAEYDASGDILANYVQGSGLVGRYDQNGIAYYDFDAIGNTTSLTLNSGEILNEYQYLPFGEIIAQSTEVNNPFTFGGELGVITEERGLFQMRARFYDSSTGHFLSNDPLGQKYGGIQLREYAYNNPISYVDPSGFVAKLGVKFIWGCVPHVEIFFSDGTSGFFGVEAGTRPTVPGIIRGQPGAFGVRTGEDPNTYHTIWTYEDEAHLWRVIQKLDAEAGNYAVNPLRGDSCITFAWKVERLYRRGFPDPKKFSPLVKNKAKLTTIGLLSKDPNDITGPGGVGSANYTKFDQTFPYTIRFENDPEQATAPAQEVFITHQLDSDLDWTTFELGDIGFGSMVISVPPGRKAWATRVVYQNQDGSELLVDVSGELNPATGIVNWTFRSIDPDQGGLPDGVFDGFLPVNDDSGRGEGFVHFLVRPKSSLASGTVVEAQASIVFDINEPIITNTWINTLDLDAPSSQVGSLPAITSTASFSVFWSGTDNGASGVASYDVYVSENNGPYTLWLDDTTLTSADFSGANGRIYRFYSLATDQLGNLEVPSGSADASTEIRLPSGFTAPSEVTAELAPTFTWNAVPGAVSYEIWILNISTGVNPYHQGTTTTNSYTPAQPLGIGRYRVWRRSVDSSGSKSAWSPQYTFQINAPTIMAPMDRFYTNPRPVVTWEPLPGAVSYELWIDNLSTGQRKFVYEPTWTETSWSASTDWDLGTYRIWVRGRDGGNIRTSWFSMREILIVTPPTAISPINPIFDRQPEFRWSSVAGASEYEFYLYHVESGNAIWIKDLPQARWTSSVPLAEGRYYWQTLAQSPEGRRSFWSSPIHISIGGRPRLISPSGSVGSNTVFSWTPVTGAARYELWVDRVGVQSGYIRQQTLTQSQYTPAAPLPTGTYRAWVRAISGSGQLSLWSLPVQFEVASDVSVDSLDVVCLTVLEDASVDADHQQGRRNRELQEFFIRRDGLADLPLDEMPVASEVMITPLLPDDQSPSEILLDKVMSSTVLYHDDLLTQI